METLEEIIKVKDQERIFRGYSSILSKYRIDLNSKTEEVNYLEDFKVTIEEDDVLTNKQKHNLISMIDEYLTMYIKSDEKDKLLLLNIIKSNDIEKIKSSINLMKNDIDYYLDIRSFIIDNRCDIEINTYKEIMKYINNGLNNRLITEIHNEIRKNKVSLKRLINLSNGLVLDDKKKIEYHYLKLIDFIVESLSFDSDLRVKINNLEKYNELKNDLLKKLNALLINANTNDKIKLDIENGRITLTNHFQARLVKTVEFSPTNAKIVEGQKIITLGSNRIPDRDLSFSIEDLGDIYILDIYLSDVPTFLLKNRKLASEAYKRANSLYIKDKDGETYNIDMLPVFISHKYLSLHNNHPKDVISFNFVLDKKGNVLSSSVNKNRIKVSSNITLEQIEDNNTGMFYDTINSLIELSHSLNEKPKNVPRRLVNKYVGDEKCLSIYYKNGIYTREGEYAPSSSPLKGIISDINLGMLLYDKGLLNIKDEDVYKLTDNLDEVIEHLNYMDKVKKYVYDNSKYVYRYIKGKDNSFNHK